MALEILGGYLFLGTKTDEREEEMGFWLWGFEGNERRFFQLRKVASCLAWEGLTKEFIQLEEEITEERSICR